MLEQRARDDERRISGHGNAKLRDEDASENRKQTVLFNQCNKK